MIIQPRILVIGGTGFIGGRITLEAIKRGYAILWTYAHQNSPFLTDYYAKHTPNFAEANLSPFVKLNFEGENPDFVKTVSHFKPDVVIYCAVPPTSSDVDTQHKVNVEGVTQTLSLLQQCSPESLFIYLSTNAVFDGIQGDYLETDRPTPENRHDAYRPYAMTKFAGEQVTLQRWKNSLVIRVSVVDGYRADGTLSSRLAAVIHRLQAGKMTPRYVDRLITPTVVDTIVSAVFEMIQSDFTYRGILHVAGDAYVSDFDYTQLLCRYLGLDETLVEMQYLDVSPLHEPASDTTLNIAFSRRLFKTQFLTLDEQFKCLFPKSD